MLKNQYLKLSLFILCINICSLKCSEDINEPMDIPDMLNTSSPFVSVSYGITYDVVMHHEDRVPVICPHGYPAFGFYPQPGSIPLSSLLLLARPFGNNIMVPVGNMTQGNMEECILHIPPDARTVTLRYNSIPIYNPTIIYNLLPGNGYCVIAINA